MFSLGTWKQLSLCTRISAAFLFCSSHNLCFSSMVGSIRRRQKCLPDQVWSESFLHACLLCFFCLQLWDNTALTGSFRLSLFLSARLRGHKNFKLIFHLVSTSFFLRLCASTELGKWWEVWNSPVILGVHNQCFISCWRDTAFEAHGSIMLLSGLFVLKAWTLNTERSFGFTALLVWPFLLLAWQLHNLSVYSYFPPLVTAFPSHCAAFRNLV